MYCVCLLSVQKKFFVLWDKHYWSISLVPFPFPFIISCLLFPSLSPTGENKFHLFWEVGLWYLEQLQGSLHRSLSFKCSSFFPWKWKYLLNSLPGFSILYLLLKVNKTWSDLPRKELFKTLDEVFANAISSKVVQGTQTCTAKQI